MNQTNRIRGLALAGGILWAGAANATSICDLDITNFNFTNTGVCGQVITQLDGVEVQDTDESASVASASAQQGTNPPAAGSDGTSGTANANYPNPDGIGGSVGAASFVSGGGGTPVPISSISGSFYIGEFIADDGLLGTNPFDLTVNLDVDGKLFVENDGMASFVLLFSAVDAGGSVIGDFSGGALLGSFGFFVPLFSTALSALTPDASCADFSNFPDHKCTVTVDATESIVLADLVDGDVFGLFLTIGTFANLQSGVVTSAAYADFANTVELSFPGDNVTALPSTIAAPEPASVALVLVGVLVIGLARTRRSA